MNIGKLLVTGVLLISTAFVGQQALAQKSWSVFVQEVRQEAISQGIRPEVFDRAFEGMKAPNKKVLHYDRTQPEKRLSFLKYRNTRADKFRIMLGRKELKKYTRLLNKVSREYGVSKCFIVSL